MTSRPGLMICALRSMGFCRAPGKTLRSSSASPPSPLTRLDGRMLTVLRAG